jgi:hypothetical protein
LAVLVSSRLRVVGPRHASGTRQLPSKPCRPLLLFYHFCELHLVPVTSLLAFSAHKLVPDPIGPRRFLHMPQQMIKIELATKDLMNGQRLGNCYECAKRQENKYWMCLLADPAHEMLEPIDVQDRER